MSCRATSPPLAQTRAALVASSTTSFGVSHSCGQRTPCLPSAQYSCVQYQKHSSISCCRITSNPNMQSCKAMLPDHSSEHCDFACLHVVLQHHALHALIHPFLSGQDAYLSKHLQQACRKDPNWVQTPAYALTSFVYTPSDSFLLQAWSCTPGLVRALI